MTVVSTLLSSGTAIIAALSQTRTNGTCPSFLQIWCAAQGCPCRNLVAYSSTRSVKMGHFAGFEATTFSYQQRKMSRGISKIVTDFASLLSMAIHGGQKARRILIHTKTHPTQV